MIRTVLTAIAVALLAAGAQSAVAQEDATGFYVGGGLGISRVADPACDALSQIKLSLPQQFQCEEEDTAWKLFVGWQPIRWIGFEAGYLDLGKQEARAGTTNLSAEVDGGFLAGTFTLPVVERIGIYGKAGAYFWDGELSGMLQGVGTIPTIEDDDTSGFWGLGLRLPLSDSFAVRLEYERYLDLGTKATIDTPIGPLQFDGGESDVDYFSLQGLFSF